MESSCSTQPNVAPPPNEQTEANSEQTAASSQDAKQNEYAYLKRGWSSELHKLSIKNLPRYVRYGQVQKLLRKLSVSVHKLTVAVPCAYVTFLNEELLADAEKRLAGQVWKGNVLQINRAKPKPDPIMKKRAEERGGAPTSDVKDSQDGAAVCNIDELRKSIVPFYNVDYETQIKTKTGKVRAFLRDFAKKRRDIGCGDSKSQTTENDGQSGSGANHLEFIRSPSVQHYRNKCELSVAVCAMTKQDLTIGFRVGKLSRNETRVLSLQHCAFHVPQCVASLINTVLQPAFYDLGAKTTGSAAGVSSTETQQQQEHVESDCFRSFNPLDQSGHLKTVIYRYSEYQNRAVFFIEVNLEDDKDPQGRLERLRTSIQARISDSDGKLETTATTNSSADGEISWKPAFSYEIYALRSNAGSQISYEKDRLLHLISSDNTAKEEQNDQPGCITEALGDFKFRIAPASFFQVNTGGARLLYDAIAAALRNLLPDARRALLLDVCCGTGTIGLYLARLVHRVVGIELCEPAVRDALHNRQLNNHLVVDEHSQTGESAAKLSKCVFVCRKAEDAIGEILRGDLARIMFEKVDDPAQCEIEFSTVGRPVVAILDPPRAGVHWNVIAALRKCRSIDYVLYISCNAFAAMSNFVELVRPESRRVGGAPFRLSSVTPIDLFPMTEHFELLLVFTRDSHSASSAGTDPVKPDSS